MAQMPPTGSAAQPHCPIEVPTESTGHVRRISLGARMALRAGAMVARASRAAGFQGQMIGGRVALMLRPTCLAELAGGRRVVLVSGTNGKTTTTAMLAAALGTAGKVVSNVSGANMLDGLTSAMAADPALTVVGEIDELYLPTAMEQTRAAAMVLLNLTRDQLDRACEIRRIASDLQAVAERFPALLVIANCDDPYLVLIAESFTQVVWVAAGASWQGDGASCPRCGYRLVTESEGDNAGWACHRCGLSRPQPHWRLTPEVLVTPEGARLALNLRLPGAFNRINAAMAIAAGQALGVDPKRAVDAVGEVTGTAGRYQKVQVGSHEIELLLAKNPAGWSVLLDLLCSHSGPVIIAVNGREADGHDTSWLYDVSFERLAGRQVVAAGERASDLGVRLSYAGVAHTTSPDPLAALGGLDPGRVLFVGDYTSFWRLRSVLEARQRD
ncbi:MAG: MurT ligase domain-containing protein [Pseudonocardiaceae bacterium]